MLDCTGCMLWCVLAALTMLRSLATSATLANARFSLKLDRVAENHSEGTKNLVGGVRVECEMVESGQQIIAQLFIAYRMTMLMVTATALYYSLGRLPSRDMHACCLLHSSFVLTTWHTSGRTTSW